MPILCVSMVIYWNCLTKRSECGYGSAIYLWKLKFCRITLGILKKKLDNYYQKWMCEVLSRFTLWLHKQPWSGSVRLGQIDFSSRCWGFHHNAVFLVLRLGRRITVSSFWGWRTDIDCARDSSRTHQAVSIVNSCG